MQTRIHSKHFNDSNGNPAGGTIYGQGFAIGAFVEDIIAAALDRLCYYQRSRFYCTENLEAAHHLEEAPQALNSRTAKREARNVEGTHAL